MSIPQKKPHEGADPELGSTLLRATTKRRAIWILGRTRIFRTSHNTWQRKGSASHRHNHVGKDASSLINDNATPPQRRADAAARRQNDRKNCPRVARGARTVRDGRLGGARGGRRRALRLHRGPRALSEHHGLLRPEAHRHALVERGDEHRVPRRNALKRLLAARRRPAADENLVQGLGRARPQVLAVDVVPGVRAVAHQLERVPGARSAGAGLRPRVEHGHELLRRAREHPQPRRRRG